MYDNSVRAGLTTVSQFVPRFFLSVYSNNSLWVAVLSLCRWKDRKNRFVIYEICKLIRIKSLIFRFRHRNLMFSLNCAMLKYNQTYTCVFIQFIFGVTFFLPLVTNLGLNFHISLIAKRFPALLTATQPQWQNSNSQRIVPKHQ